MRFGIYNEIQASPGADHKQRYDDSLRAVELGDRLGYDVFMTLEHHFFPTFSISVNPLAFFAAAPIAHDGGQFLDALIAGHVFHALIEPANPVRVLVDGAGKVGLVLLMQQVLDLHGNEVGGA